MGRRSRSRSRSRERHRHKRSRSRSRDRRSRSRDRRSRRSRSRSPRERRRASGFGDGAAGGDAGGGAAEAMQAAMAQLQQQALQKQLLAQQMALQQQALAAGAAAAAAMPQANAQANRKQRELYIGNLAVGQVSDITLLELFNGALAHLVTDPENEPPCIGARVEATGGRFGFVELRTEELATAGLMLDKIELAGKPINVGRPKGYVEPPGGPIPPQMGVAALLAAQLANQPTNVLLLENMLPARTLLDEQERKDLAEDVSEEAKCHAKLVGVCVPKPPDGVGSLEGGRCYLKFESPAESLKAKDVFDGRTFDGNKVAASFVSEEDYAQAEAGAWLPPKQPPMDPAMAAAAGAAGLPGLPPGLPPLPGMLPGMPPLPAGMQLPGLGALPGLPAALPGAGAVPGLAGLAGMGMPGLPGAPPGGLPGPPPQ